MFRRHLELAGLFLKLGTISFGGPAAHLAILEEEVVRRRQWLSTEDFLDMVGATNLIPGPNAIEMAGHVGYRRAGLLGSVVAALCFTVPAVGSTLLLAWIYGTYGKLPEVEAFLYGIKPAVLAIVFAAIWRLGRNAFRNWQMQLVGLAVVAAVVAGGDEVIVLLVASAVGMILLAWNQPPRNSAAGLVAAAATGNARSVAAATVAATGAAATASASATLWKLGLFFLKIGAAWYGGGYVLLAYLDGGLVGRYPGFGQQQLIDAVAIGQLTPGPMLTCATFAGYLIAGFSGAGVATAAILAPSFVFVAITNPLIPRLRKSRWASRFLDAVTAGSVALMVAVTITLVQSALVDWQSWLIAAAAVVVAFRWRPAPAWLVLGGAVAGRLLWGL